jgi:hypothetical protein
MILYVAMDIGCLECGMYSEPSTVLGIFKIRKEAEDACVKASAQFEVLSEDHWPGHHEFRVLEYSMERE